MNKFKEWLESQPNTILNLEEKRSSRILECSSSEILNQQVESRLGVIRLEEQIKLHNKLISSKDASNIAYNFKESGGTIVESQGLKITINVSGQLFEIPKMFTKFKI